MLLVKFSRDWADEFQAEGLSIMTEEQYENVLANARAGTCFMFGTNEGWEEGEDISDAFSSVTITDDEATILKRLVPGLGTEYSWRPVSKFGQFPTHYANPVEDNEEEYN